eukprot:1488896-Pleurochrysis_carterae.AAC.2
MHDTLPLATMLCAYRVECPSTRYPITSQTFVPHFLRVLHDCCYFHYVRCYITSFRINTPTLAHTAKLARTLPRGALGRPPPPRARPPSGAHDLAKPASKRVVNGHVSGRSRPPSRHTSSSSASAAWPISASRGPAGVEPSRAAHASP